MVKIALDIEDMTNRFTLKGMLEAAGHGIGSDGAEVAIVDTPKKALPLVKGCPTLILATVGDIPDAIDAMRVGVFGYILLPFQPGEAALMVARALDASASGNTEGEATVSKKSRTLAEVEGEHILATLRRCNDNHSKASDALGIGRNTLWRKLKQIKKS